MNLGVRLYPQYLLEIIHEGGARLLHTVTGSGLDLEADAVILVTDRLPNNDLYKDLKPALAAGVLDSLRVIGDAEAPNIIAQAIYAGHLAGREFDEIPSVSTPFRIERVTPIEAA